RAFLRFFQGDFASAVYILTPLLENSLRHVLKEAKLGITGAETDGLFIEWNRLLYRPNIDLSPADTGDCTHRVAIGGEHRLVFANSLLAPTRGAQELSFD